MQFLVFKPKVKSISISNHIKGEILTISSNCSRTVFDCWLLTQISPFDFVLIDIDGSWEKFSALSMLVLYLLTLSSISFWKREAKVQPNSSIWPSDKTYCLVLLKFLKIKGIFGCRFTTTCIQRNCKSRRQDYFKATFHFYLRFHRSTWVLRRTTLPVAYFAVQDRLSRWEK